MTKKVTLLLVAISIFCGFSCSNTDSKNQEKPSERKPAMSQENAQQNAVPQIDYHSIEHFVNDLALSHYEKSDLLRGFRKNNPNETEEELQLKYLDKVWRTDEPDTNTIIHSLTENHHFWHYKLFPNLFCLNLTFSDGIIDESRTFFFLYNEANALVDVTKKVAPEIDFSLFYTCDYNKDSLNEDCNNYYAVKFLPDNSNMMEVSFGIDDYHEETTNIKGYEELCEDNTSKFFEYKNGKYVSTEK